jgi:hypothetical protein
MASRGWTRFGSVVYPDDGFQGGSPSKRGLAWTLQID